MEKFMKNAEVLLGDVQCINAIYHLKRIICGFSKKRLKNNFTKSTFIYWTKRKWTVQSYESSWAFTYWGQPKMCMHARISYSKRNIFANVTKFRSRYFKPNRWIDKRIVFLVIDATEITTVHVRGFSVIACASVPLLAGDSWSSLTWLLNTKQSVHLFELMKMRSEHEWVSKS